MTTDPQKAYAFWQKHKKIIYKSISGVRSIVSRLSEDQRERLEHVRWCPTQFQQYIPGIEYRVHVVGPEIFACRIISQADDYRYATRKQETVMMEACTIPEEIATRCQRLAHDLGLLVAGLDLRCTPQGTWYCFEANPSPGFVYFERATGLPIADAIARLLMMGADSG